MGQEGEERFDRSPPLPLFAPLPLTFYPLHDRHCPIPLLVFSLGFSSSSQAHSSPAPAPKFILCVPPPVSPSPSSKHLALSASPFPPPPLLASLHGAALFPRKPPPFFSQLPSRFDVSCCPTADVPCGALPRRDRVACLERSHFLLRPTILPLAGLPVCRSLVLPSSVVFTVAVDWLHCVPLSLPSLCFEFYSLVGVLFPSLPPSPPAVAPPPYGTSRDYLSV